MPFVPIYSKSGREMKPHLLIVGVGSIGERQLRCFLQTKRTDVSICEPNDALRQRIQAKYQVVEALSSIEECLSTPPTAAVICTPANTHIALATRLAACGVHLLIEKPLSTSLEGLPELIRLVKQHKLAVGVGYVMRHNPTLAAMKAALDSGRFGAPKQLGFVSGQCFPHYRPAYRDIYYASRAAGGGAVQDALTHGINAGEWLMGPVTELVADIDHQVLPDVEVEDTVHVVARHGGVMANYSLNQFQAPNETTFTVACQQGTLRWQSHQSRWQWQIDPDGEWQTGDSIPVERDDLFVAQANSFLDALLNDAKSQCSLQEAIQTLKVNLKVLRSAETRTWQVIEVNSHE